MFRNFFNFAKKIFKKLWLIRGNDDRWVYYGKCLRQLEYCSYCVRFISFKILFKWKLKFFQSKESSKLQSAFLVENFEWCPLRDTKFSVNSFHSLCSLFFPSSFQLPFKIFAKFSDDFLNANEWNFYFEYAYITKYVKEK